MSPLDLPYQLMCFLLSISTIIFSILLFAIHIPRTKGLKPYNISRYILASAYLVLGILNGYRIFYSPSYPNSDWSRTIALISASSQAFLFTFTLLVLIQPNYVTLKRNLIQIGLILFLFSTLLILLYNTSGSLYSYIYYSASVIYIVQLVYYVNIFRKKYAQCLTQLKNCYDEDEDNRLRWIKLYFYSALSIGILALARTYMPSFFTGCFYILTISFYILFAIQYSNYPLKFRYIIAAVSNPDKNSGNVFFSSEVATKCNQIPQSLSPKEEALKKALEKWVEDKGFQSADMSRDEIAEHLGTDRDFLTYFFYSHMKIEFRVWRTQLRINEAKSLLIKYPNMSVSKIGHMVGIPDRSNFQKKFMELTNFSPTEWRKQNLKN